MCVLLSLLEEPKARTCSAKKAPMKAISAKASTKAEPILSRILHNVHLGRTPAITK